MLTTPQRQAIAGSLACGNLASVIAKLQANASVLGASTVADGIAFARAIDKHYSKRDGFVPKRVQALCK